MVISSLPKNPPCLIKIVPIFTPKAVLPVSHEGSVNDSCFLHGEMPYFSFCRARRISVLSAAQA
jgi:hypothetical protein